MDKNSIVNVKIDETMAHPIHNFDKRLLGEVRCKIITEPKNQRPTEDNYGEAELLAKIDSFNIGDKVIYKNDFEINEKKEHKLKIVYYSDSNNSEENFLAGTFGNSIFHIEGESLLQHKKGHITDQPPSKIVDYATNEKYDPDIYYRKSKSKGTDIYFHTFLSSKPVDGKSHSYETFFVVEPQ